MDFFFNDNGGSTPSMEEGLWGEPSSSAGNMEPGRIGSIKQGKLPFNISILTPTDESVQQLNIITSQDLYDGMTTDLHDSGLFSTRIFGRVGEERRDTTFAYIDVKVPIFHPLIFRKITQLKSLYGDILRGARYAKWDEHLADFIPATEIDGETGYHFFASNWTKIKFKKTDSISRQQRVELLEKYRDNCMSHYVLVEPAGLRDLELGADGRPAENEVNDLYRKLISISNTIIHPPGGEPTAVMDRPRMSIQNLFNQIYDLFEKMLSGKKGFIQSKWASRRCFNGTRNVITSMNTVPKVLGSPHSPRYTDTVIGLFQAMKSMLPVTQHCLLTGYLASVFGSGDNLVRLIDTTTLKSTYVDISPEVKDKWYTADGLERLINLYGDYGNRHKPIVIDGYYLGLVYNDGNYVRIFNDIADLPSTFDKKFVTPLTMCQLFYLSCYKRFMGGYMFTTRYPINSMGSIYRATMYVKTTMVGATLEELDGNWEPRGSEYIAPEFPTNSTSDMDAMSPHPSRLALLDGDFDGDTGSANATYTKESTDEGINYFKTRASLVDPKGGFWAGANTSTIKLVIRNMTGGLNK